MKPSLILVDHYDSFTANLEDWLSHEFHVHVFSYEELPDLLPQGPIVLSPGPKSPKEAAQSCDLVHKFYGERPLLGVCLGHQILGACFGSQVVRSKVPAHGEVKQLHVLAEDPLLEGLPNVLSVAAYHSLIVETVPTGWKALARCQDAELHIMVNGGQGAPAYGVQFHPESFMTPIGMQLLNNWKAVVEPWCVR